MKAISELRFGFIDAGEYMQRPKAQDAEFFSKSFYKSGHLRKILDPKTYFLIGEKGAGKTAYAVYASNYHSKYNATTLAFETSDFSRFIEIARKLDLSPSQYSILWSFIFSLAFVSNARNKFGKFENKTINAVMETVAEMTFDGNTNSIEKCISLSEQIDAFFDIFIAKSSIAVSQYMIKTAKPSFKLSRVVDLIAEGLSEVNQEFQYTLFVDGFDVKPDEVAYKSYVSVVSSLCNMIWTLNSAHFSKSTAVLKIVLLIRPDIFDLIEIQNRGPKVQDHSHLLEWPTFYMTYQASDLFHLIDLVLKCQQDAGSDLPIGKTWDHYFNFKIYNRTSDSEDDNPFIGFLRHSFHKPRDILRYLSIMAERMTPLVSPETDHFTPDVFKDSQIRTTYSNYMAHEVRDQVSFYYTSSEYQQFLIFHQTFLYKQIDMKTRVFQYDKFVRAHSEFIEANSKLGVETVPSFQTADALLQFLYQMNAIGFHTQYYKNGKKETRTNYCFKHRSIANLRPKVPTEGSFVMHYGVAKFLFTSFV